MGVMMTCGEIGQITIRVACRRHSAAVVRCIHNDEDEDVDRPQKGNAYCFPFRQERALFVDAHTPICQQITARTAAVVPFALNP